MRVLVAAAAALAAVGLTGCGDSRPCIEGHNEVYMQPIVVNNTVTVVPELIYVCDKHATLSRNP